MVKKENLSINDYTLKIKGICKSLASIGVTVEDDDKVEVCLRGLTPAYKQFKTSIQTRENIPSFADLIPMCWLLKRRTLVKIHLLHKAEIVVLSRSSILTEVEVEHVVQVKDVVVAVATRIKANSNSSQMMHRD